jgi:hypothetical protein
MNMTTTVKLAANAIRHLAKYEGSTNEDYVAFARATARKVHVSRMDQIVCEVSKVYSVNHLVHTQAELEFYMTEVDTREYVLEHSINAYQIGLIWKELKADAEGYYSKTCVIDEFLGQFTKGSFERFGDVNWSKDVHRGWFSEKGLALDVALMEMNSSSGFVIEMDDLIDFVKTYRRNEYVSSARKKQQFLEDKWKGLFGFNIRDYYVEHLIKVCEFVGEIEDNEVPF